MVRKVLPPLLILLLLASSAPSAAEPAIGKLDISYAKYIVERLTSIGSYKEPRFLGFRATGTEQDLEAARFVAEEMKKIGLTNVSLEPVPVDAWKFKGARLELEDGKVYLASSFGGVPGTGERGIEGEIVYVAGGLRKDYEGLNVSGKLVLAYWNPDDGWFNMIAHEATVHGAKGVILYNPPNGSYAQYPNALHSFDGLYSSDFIPMIVISKEDAQEILKMLEKGPIRGKIVSLAEVRRGTGWNTIGYIPGEKPDEYILIAAHHDAWFYGAADDTSAVAALLTLAKAIKESGYTPKRTLVFMTHTAEEYGMVDAYYEWLIGAWWRITEAHPEWQSKAIAYLNLEAMALRDAVFSVAVIPELSGLVSEVLNESKDLLPHGWELEEIYCWTEVWPYAAAGVPGMNFWTASEWWRRNIYHTQFDAPDRIDWDYLSNIIAVLSKIVIGLDESRILPYDFTARVDHMNERLNVTLMRELGVDPEDLLRKIREFSEAASEFNELIKADVPDDVVSRVNEKVREAARVLLTGLTALDPWDNTIYPHQQAEQDTLSLKLALEALKKGDPETALSAIEGVSINWYAPRFSYEVFLREMYHKSPGWPRINWGALGHLAPIYDLWKEYNSISEKMDKNLTDYSEEMRVVEMYYRVSLGEYQRRVNEMAKVMELASSKIREANSIMKEATPTKVPAEVEFPILPISVLVVILALVVGVVLYRKRKTS